MSVSSFAEALWKKKLRILFLIVVNCILGFGVAIPKCLSAKDDGLVILGLVLGIINLLWVGRAIVFLIKDLSKHFNSN